MDLNDASGLQTHMEGSPEVFNNLLFFKISRNSALFYWKSVNLIGSPTVLNIFAIIKIENDRVHIALIAVVFLGFS